MTAEIPMQKLIQILTTIMMAGAAANAGAIFNFDTDALGTTTAFTDTNNGVSATFASAADPGGFVIYPSIFDTLTGNVLGDPGPAGVDGLALNIDFNQPLAGIQLDFATSDLGTPSPLTLTAYENGALVGSDTQFGQVPGGFLFPEGAISFHGGVFNQIVISSTAADFAVDNINVTSAPEPGTAALIGIGLILPSLLLLRRRN